MTLAAHMLSPDLLKQGSRHHTNLQAPYAEPCELRYHQLSDAGRLLPSPSQSGHAGRTIAEQCSFEAASAVSHTHSGDANS